MTAFTIPLRGPAGEPVDLRRTLLSHGTFSLAPARLDEERFTLEVALAVPGAKPRAVRVTARGAAARVEITGSAGPRVVASLEATLRRMLNLGEDLSGFYAIAAGDPDLAWVTAGAGRMARSPTVFEDVIKTLTTTNCSWALTTKMMGALVEHLGEPAGDLRTFPTPEAMAAQPERFYREVVRSGYRAPHFVTLSRAVAARDLDLEALLDPGLAYEQVEERLLALPGIGPYGAAHIALTLGRYERLVLDSWTRPKFREVAGFKTQPKDATIERRFRRYGPWAGLAFWCLLTRGWVA